MSPGNKTGGYTLIEMVVVVVLIAILAGFSLQALVLSSDTYIVAVREYLELFREGYLAMDRMCRELRETHPESISIGLESIAFTKRAETPRDPSLEIRFFQRGDQILRESAAGEYALVERAVPGSFNASMNEQSVVTLSFSVKSHDVQAAVIPIRSAAFPRLKPSPTPDP